MSTKLHVLLLPLSSVAEQFTVVAPMLKKLPDGGTHVVARPLVLLSAAIRPRGWPPIVTKSPAA